MRREGNKTKKRVFYILDFGWKQEFAAYLEKMAKEGWMFVKKRGAILYFEACAPKKVHFCIEYNKKAYKMSTEPNYYTEEYVELCEQGGWHLMQCMGKAMIFSSEASNPIPIQTDPQVEFEETCKYWNRRLLPTKIFAVLCAILLVSCIVTQSLADALTRDASLLDLILSAIYLFSMLPDLIVFRHFRKENKERLANGEGLSYYDGRKYLKKKVAFSIVSLLCVLLAISCWTSGIRLAFLVVFIAVLIVLRFFIPWVVGGNPKMDSGGGYVLNFLAIFLLLFIALTFFNLTGHNRDYFRYTYADGSQLSAEFYNDDIPITLQDLGVHVKGLGYAETFAEENQTIFGLYADYWQNDYDQNAEKFGDELIDDMSYSVLQSKFKTVVNSEMKEYLSYDDMKWKEVKSEELKIWGADKAYIGEDSEDQGSTTYRIVKWKDKVLWFSGEKVKMTKENIQRIKKKLKL